MRAPHRHVLSVLSALAMLAVATAARAADLDGTWRFDLSAAEGEHSFTITLEVDGDEVTGTAGDESFTGTFKDGKLTLSGEHYVGEAGYSALLEITATLEGERLRGNATWDMFEASMTGRRTG